MTPKEAYEVLREFNLWRRGEGKYAFSETPSENEPLPYTPKEISVALDVAIDTLEGRQRLGKPKEMLPPCACGGKAATVERGTEPKGFAIMCSRCFRKTALHLTLALAEEEWRTMLTHNTTTKENNQ